jgi:acetoin utilization protein AcuB
MNAQRVMTVEVTCVPPELPLERVHQLMQKLRVRHVPVVAAGKLCGILSDRDLLLRATTLADGTRSFPAISAGEAMSLCPVSCGPGTPIATLAGLMVDHRIDSVPIIGAAGELAGLVTSTDLLELLRRRDVSSEELPLHFTLRGVEEVLPGARA